MAPVGGSGWIEGLVSGAETELGYSDEVRPARRAGTGMHGTARPWCSD